MKTFACTFIASAFAALVLTPLVARIALKLGIVDRPGPRRIHPRPIPRMGGVAILLAMLGPIIPVMLLSNAVGSAFREIQTRVIAMLAASVAMVLVGLVDDVRGLRSRFKFLAQIAAAAVVCAFGIRIETVSVEGLFTLHFGWLAWPITILWIVSITNAVNLIDGLDGLAAGIAAVACGVIAVLAISAGQTVMAVLMLALLGSLMGFVVFNFNPARIFMGDSGSMFVGFVLATTSVMCAVKSQALVGLALPALALGVPIFDTLFSMLRRILERRSLFSPDRGHIHHRLLDLGLRHRHVVLIMYGLTVLAAGLGMFMMATRSTETLLILAGILLLLALVFRCVGSVRLRESIAALKRNLSIAQETKGHKEAFEESALRIREAKSLDAWWNALCAAAEEMDFVCVSLALDGSDGTVGPLVWRHPSLNGTPDEIIRIAIPKRSLREGVQGRVELDVWVNGSLESAGRRAALFGRLLDEHCPAASSAEDASDKPGGRVPRFQRLSLAISKE